MKRPKLHIRDLFWLVLVAALLCGWWLDQRIAHRVNELDKLKEKMEAERAASQAALAAQQALLQAERQLLLQAEQQALLQAMIQSTPKPQPIPIQTPPPQTLQLESEYHQMQLEGKPIQ
jgi:hypothetical protein